MKQFVLHPRSTGFVAPRSDTLLGLIAWGVRVVFGRDSVERFIGDPPYVTSAFPWVDEGDRRVHFFPGPVGGAEAAPGDANRRWLAEDQFLAFIAGQGRDADRRTPPNVERGHGGAFFFADGNNEHYVEPALQWLERAGFGSDTQRGGRAFAVEVKTPEFLRRARAGETGVLLSLALPSNAEREALASALERRDARIAYSVERRHGFATSRPIAGGSARKRPVLALTEGSIVPLGASDAYGDSPTVATLADDRGPFAVRYCGRGFVVPLLSAGGGA
ncbi:MAG: hypothetical protein JNL94_15825 [Planctomycetes bacterium]|nr:hypothetical protein [Planctomycetota bacterium]